MSQPERKMEKVPEESTTHKHRKPRKKTEDKPPFFRRHPTLAAIGTAAALGAITTGCAPSARAQGTTPSTQIVQSPDSRVAPSEVPARPTTVVAQATRPGEIGYQGTSVGGTSPENRLYDGGGAILRSTDASPMTQQQFQETIAYMFDLTSQFEVLPDSSGRYVTDEFIVKRSIGPVDRASLYNIVVYGKNALDGGDAREPLAPFASRLDENFRVFRFPVSDSPVIKGEVVVVLLLGGVEVFYFNKAQNLYTMAGAAYGPNYFGPNPKIGLEMAEDSGIKYIGAVVMDPSKFDSYGKPVAGAEVASMSLDVSGPNVSERAQLGANMYKIQ